jgi:uncharacterized protein (DUF302 family)
MMFEMEYRMESGKSLDALSELIEKTAPEHNFRVLAVHNVQETLSEKGFEIKPLKIFELCNAGFANEALKKDLSVALFMPCKIILRTENDKSLMILGKPSVISQMLPDSGLEEMAKKVEDNLIGLMNAIK